MFGTKSSLTLCNQQQPSYEPPSLAGSSNNLLPNTTAGGTSIFGNFATSTSKSVCPGGIGGSESIISNTAAASGLGLTASTTNSVAAAAAAAAQFQQHVSLMNKYQQRLIDTLNPILDGSSTLGCKDLDRGIFTMNIYQ